VAHDGQVLADAVLAWYAVAARDLPWRRPGTTSWGVLVSEVMLQQTPVARVAPAYGAWLARWPTPASLAADPAGEAIRMWGRLGYPRRALRLHEAATVLVARHGGEVPSDVRELLALPGVGDYTARAVASFAFGQRHPVVDTNVRRVLERLLPDLPSGAIAQRAALEALVPVDPARAARFAVALMELGALVCRPGAPRCVECPVRSECGWDGVPRARQRRQPYAGTDRQARGALLAVLREGSAPEPALLAACAAPDQAARVLAGLLADGLAVRRNGEIALP
jgi:A/G-specific adenine glycosylase